MASACLEMWRYPVIEASGEERIKDGVAVLGVLYYQTEDLGSLYTSGFKQGLATSHVVKQLPYHSGFWIRLDKKIF